MLSLSKKSGIVATVSVDAVLITFAASDFFLDDTISYLVECQNTTNDLINNDFVIHLQLFDAFGAGRTK